MLMLYGMEYFLDQFGLAVPAVSTPNFLPTPIYWLGAGGGRVRKRESFDTVQVLCKNSQNTGALSTLFLSQNPKHSTLQAAINKL